jgi:hypothetical protein
MAAFRATCLERFRRVLPPDDQRPIRVFRQDESRLGLLTVRRRRLTARGIQPVGLVQHPFEWFYPGSRGSGHVRGFFDQAGLKPMSSR